MNLLLDEQPLLIMPRLAVLIGLNEAIVLQQINYWLKSSKNIRDGEKWIYNTFVEWGEQFPFWSDKTIKRAFANLEKSGLVITNSSYNKVGIDRTKWYRIDYDLLAKMSAESPLGQNDPTIGSNCPHDWVNLSSPLGQNDPTNNQRLPETTTETTTSVSASEQIKNLLGRYPEEISGTIEAYRDMISLTRSNGKVADSVWIKIFERFHKYDVKIVHYAMLAHLNGKSGAKENYTFGILRNTSREEAVKGIERYSKPAATKNDKDWLKEW